MTGYRPLGRIGCAVAGIPVLLGRVRGTGRTLGGSRDVGDPEWGPVSTEAAGDMVAVALRLAWRGFHWAGVGAADYEWRVDALRGRASVSTIPPSGCILRLMHGVCLGRTGLRRRNGNGGRGHFDRGVVPVPGPLPLGRRFRRRQRRDRGRVRNRAGAGLLARPRKNAPCWRHKPGNGRPESRPLRRQS